VVVKSGTTLTIEENVQIRFDLDSGLFVEGALFVTGSNSLQVLFTSNESNPTYGDWLGVQINKSGVVHMEDCMIEFAVVGVHAMESIGSTFHHCRFERNVYGLRFESSANNSIVDSQMAWGQVGIVAYDMSNSTFVNVTTYSNDRGMELVNCHNNSITNLSSAKNLLDGVYLASSWNNTIIGGVLSTNRRFGLFLDKAGGYPQSENNTIKGLNISGNIGGIHIQDSSLNVFLENNITNNIDGIFVVAPSSGNIIADNSILGNLKHAILAPSGNTAEFNYFGTTNVNQLAKIIGGGIVAQSPLGSRESGVEMIVGDVVWTGKTMTKEALLVEGNLTLDRVQIEFSSESGSNFIQVGGSLTVLNSTLHSTDGNFSILFLNGSHGYVDGSVFVNQTGFGIHTEEGMMITNSTMRGGRIGILTHKSSNGQIDSLAVSNSMIGMTFSETHNYSVNNSVIQSNQGTGISLYLTSNVTITHSNISTNGLRGIYLSLSHYNVIVKNNISFNDESGVFLSNSHDNLIFSNNLVSNILQAFDNSNLSAFDNGYPAGGNFWSNHGGSDSYGGPNQDLPGGDGILDSPYSIPTSSWDRYPLATPYIEAGNRSWPDIAPPARITDLTVSSTNAFSAMLQWTAPGDDGNTGPASAYDVRYSTGDINDNTWENAVRVHSDSPPELPGTRESLVVSGLLEAQKYYFAISTSDEVPNWSDLSNVASGHTTDASPPSIEDVSIAPDPQEVFGFVNITARIVDNVEVTIHVVNISYPSLHSLNITMNGMEGDSYYLNGSYDELGAYQLVVWACDNSSNCNSLNETFEMVDSSPPIAIAGGDMEIRVGEQVLLDASNSTDNYGIMNYTWSIRINEGEIQLHGQVLYYSFDEEGEFNVTLLVTDVAGNQARDWLLVKVTNGVPGIPPFLWWIVLIVASVLVSVIILVIVKRRRGRKASEEDSNGDSPPNSA
jgi:parallel beta-helix repeat protein